MFNAVSYTFSSFWLDFAFIISYLADKLSQIISIINRLLLSSNSYSRFSTMFLYFSGRFVSLRVVISISSIITSNFSKLSLNIYMPVIQSSVSLVTSVDSNTDHVTYWSPKFGYAL